MTFRPIGHEGWRFRTGDTWRVARVSTQRLICNNAQALRDGAIEGLGLAILPTFIASEPIVRGALKPVLSSHHLVEPSIYAVWPPGRQLSAKARALVDALSRRFESSQYWDLDIERIITAKAT